MSWLVVGALLPSALVSWLMVHVVRRRAVAWGLVDEPGERKVHSRTTPLGGGLGIWLGVILPLAVGQLLLWLVSASRGAAPDLGLPVAGLRGMDLPAVVETHLAGLWAQSGRLWILMLAGTALAALGLWDDLREADWRVRLAIEFLIAAAVVAAGWRLSVFLDAPWVTVPLSVLWIVGLVNTFNMLDNMDGLSGGVAMIAAGILAAVLLAGQRVSDSGPQLFVGGYMLVLVGSLLGFLWHNRPPARIFMGDAGAYFIGFWLATGTIMATFAGGQLPRHAILAPLCVLAVPLYDTLTVVLIRLRAGRSPFQGDKNHFSHRLVELGLSRPQAVLTIYLATATTGLGALLLYQVNAWGAMVILLLVACVLSLVGVLETTARRKAQQAAQSRE